MNKKYLLYEYGVQSPRWQTDYLPQFHRWLTRKNPYVFREDFCGTARIACEWVKQSSRHQALGLDLDPEPLRIARERNLSQLSSEEKSRIRLKRQDVRTRTSETFDMIGAFNFSCFTFLTRADLVRYFRAVHESLQKPGTLFLEVAGGPGFIETRHDQRSFSVPGVGRVKQIWEQHQYDPITGINDYSIHFGLPDGTWLQDAFQYHWRIWGIPELRDALADAGFRKSVVLWEQVDSKGRGTGELLPTESAELPESYLAYLVAVK